jgi:hypothetical protein
LALAGNHAVARALQRNSGPRRLQRYTITHAGAGESIWAAVKHFDPDGWDEIDTDSLDDAKVQGLLAVLDRLAATDADAAGMARKIRAEQQAQQRRSPVSSNTFSMPSLSQPVLVASPQVASRPPGAMGHIWEDVYGTQAKSYRGSPDTVKEQVIGDPAVQQLYKPPTAVLDAIRWNRFAEQTEHRSPGVTVRLEFVGADKLRIELSFPPAGACDGAGVPSFPWGIQDTTLSYVEKAGNIVISEVYRHRSTKTTPIDQPGVSMPKDLKPHLFVDMIKHQATGVADLGPDVAYISKAIRSAEGWGYNVWPKMGFDAAVPAHHLKAMRAAESPPGGWRPMARREQ